MKLLPCILPALLAVAAAAPAQDQPAPAAETATQKVLVKFERPLAAGDKLELKVTAAISRTADMWFDGVQRPGDSENKDFTTEGTLEIVSVTPKTGQASACKFTVKKFTVDDGKDARELLTEGKVIEYKAGKENTTEFKIDGKEADEEVEMALQIVMHPVVLSDTSSEETFGPGGPKSLGEEWTYDPKKLCEYYEAAAGIKAAQEGSSGSAKFLRLKELDGVPCVVATGRFTLAMTGAPGLPEKSKIEKGTVTMESQQTLPLDPKLPEPAYRSVIDRDVMFTYPVKDDQSVKVRLRDHMERKVTQKKL